MGFPGADLEVEIVLPIPLSWNALSACLRSIRALLREARSGLQSNDQDAQPDSHLATYGSSIRSALAMGHPTPPGSPAEITKKREDARVIARARGRGTNSRSMISQAQQPKTAPAASTPA